MVSGINDGDRENHSFSEESLVYQVPLISSAKAIEIKDRFKILSNVTRIRMLNELTRVKEHSVCDLARAVDISPQAVSNQLQRLLDRGIVAARREGNLIYYRVVDDCVISLLKSAVILLNDKEEKS